MTDQFYADPLSHSLMPAPGKPKAAPKTPQEPTETFPVEETAEPKPPGPIAKREPDDMPQQRVEMIVPVQFLII